MLQCCWLIAVNVRHYSIIRTLSWIHSEAHMMAQHVHVLRARIQHTPTTGSGMATRVHSWKSALVTTHT